MRKWVLVSLAVFFVVLWQIIHLFLSIQADKKVGADQYTTFVENQTNLSVDHMQRFHGEELYYVYKATDEQDNHFYVFVSEDKVIHQVSMDQVKHDQESVVRVAQKEFKELQRIMRVTPAYSGGEFTWEIIALDQEDRLQYLYYSMINGEFQKRYKLTKIGL